MQSLSTRSLESLLRVFDPFQTMEFFTMMFSILEMEMILEILPSSCPEMMPSLLETSMLSSQRSRSYRKFPDLTILTLRSRLNKTQFQLPSRTFQSLFLSRLLHRSKCPVLLQPLTSLLLTSTWKARRPFSSARTGLLDPRLSSKNASLSE